MNDHERTRASKFLSLVLRHQPELIGLALDGAGWASVDDLLACLPSHGLSRRSRQYVHLSADVETAQRVAGRRRGERVILVIEAGRLHHDGGRFYRAENGVWLAEQVPPAYIGFPGDAPS